MTEPNTQSPADNQNEIIIDSLKNEIASLESQLNKKDDRTASLNVMLNQVVESHNAEVRDYEDLEDKMKGLIDRLRRRYFGSFEGE